MCVHGQKEHSYDDNEVMNQNEVMKNCFAQEIDLVQLDSKKICKNWEHKEQAGHCARSSRSLCTQ